MPTLDISRRELQAFGRGLKIAPREIRQELFRSVARATAPVKKAIKDEALASLPSSGGLNVWVSQIGIKTRQAYSGRSVGVTITGTINNKKTVRKVGRKKRKTRSGTFGARADLYAINRGRVMHPVYGRGPLVGPQSVRAGFWSRPLEGEYADTAAREIMAGLEAASAKIARSLDLAA